MTENATEGTPELLHAQILPFARKISNDVKPSETRFAITIVGHAPVGTDDVQIVSSFGGDIPGMVEVMTEMISAFCEGSPILATQVAHSILGRVIDSQTAQHTAKADADTAINDSRERTIVLKDPPA